MMWQLEGDYKQYAGVSLESRVRSGRELKVFGDVRELLLRNVRVEAEL